MQFFNYLKSPILDKCVVCIGFFDGFHKGHLEIINKVLMIAKNDKLKSFFFTFNSKKIKPIQNLIFTSEFKQQFIKNLNFDYYYELDLDDEINLKMTKLEFLNFLQSKLNVSKIVIGPDFKFAHNRSGNISDLENFFGKENIYVVNLKMINDHVTLSSNYIKKLLIDGQIEQANELLPVKYNCSGLVVKGQRLGTKLGYPTANIILNDKLLLTPGSYLAFTKYQDRFFPSMVYYSVFDKIVVESHLLKQNFNLYDQYIEIYFIKFLSKYIELSSFEDMKNQLIELYKVAVDYFWK